MRSTLFELFGQPLPAYFTLLVLGFGLAIGLAQRQARRFGLDHDTAIDLGLYALVWGVVGSRLLHVVADGYFWDYVHLCTDPSQVAWQVTQARCAQIEGVWDVAANVCRPAERDCFAWAAFWRGGLAYYGGLLAAGAFGLWFLRKERFPIGKGIDLVGLVIPIGLFFGRLGCFLGGCCFGTTVDAGAFGAVRFPGWSPASESHWKRGLLDAPHLESLPVHATQLYESAGCLLIAALAVVMQRHKRFDGQIMLFFLAAYAVLRFVLEWLRDDDRGAVLGLTTSQLIGVAMLGVVAWAWPKLRAAAAARAARPASATPSP